MIDPAHGRNIAEGAAIFAVLSRFLKLIRMLSYESTKRGELLNFEDRTYQLSLDLIPAIRSFFIEGAKSSLGRGRFAHPKTVSLLPDRLKLPAVKPAPPIVIPDDPAIVGLVKPEKPFTINVSAQAAFDVFQPTILPEVRKLALNFATAISETIKDETRKAIAKGLANGEAYSRIARDLRDIAVTETIADRVSVLPVFNRKRAQQIAHTEATRAVHAGQAAYSKALGSVGLQLLASKDACPVCLSLNGKQVKHGEPFLVRDKGNPEYRMVWNVPIHPSCRCTTLDVWEWGVSP